VARQGLRWCAIGSCLLEFIVFRELVVLWKTNARSGESNEAYLQKHVCSVTLEHRIAYK